MYVHDIVTHHTDYVDARIFIAENILVCMQ